MSDIIPGFRKPRATLNLIDKFVNFVNPRAGMERIRYRAQFNSLEEQGIIVPGSSKRSMRGWTPSPNTADTDILFKADAMRAGSRDLFYNTPIATGALRRETTNAIGFGLRLQCRLDREALGLSDEQADAWERKTEREFFSWANNPECDAARTLAFNQLTKLAFFSTSLSGDTFVLMPRVPRTGQIYDLRIQIVEADYVSNPNMAFDTVKLAGGVEIDELGAPVAYHFRRPLQDAVLGLGVNAGDTWIRIPAYGTATGRRQVLHLYDKERPGQRRGIPMLAPVVDELKQITRLSKAEIQAAIVNSYFTVFVKSQTNTGNVLQEGYIPAGPGYGMGGAGVSVKDSSDPRDERLYEMGSANVLELNENQDISIADPRRPNQLFEPFFLAICKQIGSALQIPFEQLILHFSASYSAAKAALQEAWKFYIMRRLWAAQYFCQPIYKEWLIEAIYKGRIDAPGFFNDQVIQEAWCGSSWSGPSQGQLDPLKETKAAVMRMQNNLSTNEDEYVAINGDDWEGAMLRRSREKKFLDALDLNPEAVDEAQEPDVAEQVEEGVTT